ncbi:PspC domain-containing protein [Thermococcus argininiproducens]|uniref:PspC domain-containing protein n=1 Tax=Thermococcus argininiproducens TaxID=2866384 RepID=UPI0020743F74|nr:PspC domain-containing protein [Thermococcus argininiproducens]
MKKLEKRLKRSKRNKVFLGVLGGIAEYLEVDPTIIRILFILLCLVEPVFILAYFLMAIVMPEEEEIVTAEKIPQKFEKIVEETGEKVEEFAKKAPKIEKKDDTKLFGIALVILGTALLLKEFIPIPFLGLREIVAVLILVLGLYLVARG